MPAINASDYREHLNHLLEAVESSDRDGRGLGFDEAMAAAIDQLRAIREQRRLVMLVGNGGSASIVGHLQMDLCNVLGIRAIAFHETPLLTALANDYGYVEAFERMVGLWGGDGDLLVAVSSSGRSENILRSVRAARALGCRVLGCSGFSPDNPLRSMGDLNFYVPSSDYGPVELVHSCIAHMLTDLAAGAATAS